jgi:N-sulfoglucosamine sulfohydrolase
MKTRRDFLQTVGMGLLALPLSCTSGKRSVPLPHIVMFLSDDHGLDFCGCYGNKFIQTPNLDSLAKQGIRFTNMYAASPTCAPSRSVLFTGLYPARNGAMGNHTTCKEGIGSLPGYLNQLGYRVVLANKVHVKP